MKKLLLLLLFIPLVSFGQEQAVKFKIDKPIGWVDNTSYYKDNTAKKTNLQTLLKDGTNKEILIESITDPSLYVFTKYNLEEVSNTDFIPSINVVLSTDTNWELKDMEIVSKDIFSQMRLSLDNFKLIKNDYIGINGKEGFLFHSTFNVNSINETIRSWTYFFFIDKGLFYQITFADTEEDKCNEVFEDFLNSIRFDNKYSYSLIDENYLRGFKERTYYLNGQLKSEKSENGIQLLYDKNGTLTEQNTYLDVNIIYKKIFNEKGIIVKEGSILNGEFIDDITSKYKNIKLAPKKTFIETQIKVKTLK